MVSARKLKPYESYARDEDYYREGGLVWLEVDQVIRQGDGTETAALRGDRERSVLRGIRKRDGQAELHDDLLPWPASVTGLPAKSWPVDNWASYCV